MGFGNFNRPTPGALGEIQHNQRDNGRSPHKMKPDLEPSSQPRGRSASPTKTAFGLKSMGDKWAADRAKSREPSPTKKPKKAKSSTSLAGLLSRPKSLKGLHKIATEDKLREIRDKENRTPDEPAAHTPIFSQFSSTAAGRQGAAQSPLPGRQRPQSHHPSLQDGLKSPQSGASTPQERRGRPVSTTAAPHHTRSKSSAAREAAIDPKDIDSHLEALLDRRNIPQNQRYKMRNLNDTIKMEFIRQDWAEMQAGQVANAQNTETPAVDVESEGEDDKHKRGRSRGRSFTFSRGKRDPCSSSKKSKGEGTLGRHFRSKSTDSVAQDARPTSAASGVGSGVFSKMKPQQGPTEYVTYLRKVQKPELVEVGKIHKLRLLLRNETVAWIDEFVRQGGMQEIVGLLNRIMEVEWREEHEDALLHENLLCLKALSTTALAMEYLHNVQTDIFPKLLHMIFDPERKGPSEFTTRNVITSVLLTYIASATPAERIIRAKSVLGHLRDPEPNESNRPLPFVLEMRQERPYRVWCKEAVNVTKEVFWIFLHHLNVVSHTASANSPVSERAEQEIASSFFALEETPYPYMQRHFPAGRPPVAAAPYVGGVEWDATNYLASHLDLMNAIIACNVTRDARNAIRAQLRISGWERCMGGSLRLCKEKFYGSVHAALRTWVAAAAEDGWDVRDVRFGPVPDSAAASPAKGSGGQKKKVEDAPKLEMPRFDLGL